MKPGGVEGVSSHPKSSREEGKTFYQERDLQRGDSGEKNQQMIKRTSRGDTLWGGGQKRPHQGKKSKRRKSPLLIWKTERPNFPRQRAGGG